MATPRPKLTYDDYVRFPDDGLRRQLIDGEVYVSPAPATRHQRISLRFAFALEAHVREAGGGEVFEAPYDVVLSPTDVVQPDVLVVADADAQRITDANLQGPPTIAVEIVSDPRLDRRIKRDLYARFGVKEYWIVDPDADSVEIHRLTARGYGEPETLRPGDALTTPLLPGLAIDLTDLFRR